MRTLIQAGLLAVALTAVPALAAPKRGQAAVDLDPASRGIVSGTGIEMRDIIGMSDRLVRDLLQRPDIANSQTPPRIILEGSRILNKSSQRLDTDMFSDQLRSQLLRAAAGRMRFLSRENLADVADERELKRGGQTDVGTRGLTRAVAGADYRLVGRITSQDARNNTTGMQQRAMQVIFELIDLETTETVYISEPYVILRAQGDDVVYR
ncbi:CsgG/HfaB family protein [Sandarakinorhabdus sp.]|uniref:CsgG/HfaB family protein n=1 Tax=Sandarakinorhabdus sp. TaxID=1916663 RepID=UPI00286DBFC5|nr:CsgG/HfaB family protein [Sandarakinorhabdus sp.]